MTDSSTFALRCCLASIIILGNIFTYPKNNVIEILCLKWQNGFKNPLSLADKNRLYAVRF